MKTGIALNASDQMLVAAAKGEGDRLVLVRAAWAQRVGLTPEQVPMGAVVRRLAEIVEGRQLARLPNLLASAELMMSDLPKVGPKSSPFLDAWFWVLLNTIQVAPRSAFLEPVCEV